MTFLTNTLVLKQENGGTKVKQGDFGSTFIFTLLDGQGNYFHELNTKTAIITLCNDTSIIYETTSTVVGSSVTFNISKAVQTGIFYLEIKVDDYIFPSDRSTIISVEAGATAYDIKDLIPNYDVNMTLDGILNRLNVKDGQVVDLQNKMNTIYSNALSDHAEILNARGGQANLDARLDTIEAKELADFNSQETKITNNTATIQTTNSRIDTIVANAGDGTIPSELVDVRTGYNGKIYQTAGDSVRSQIKPLAKMLENGATFTANSYIIPSNGNVGTVTKLPYYASNRLFIYGASKLYINSSFAASTGFAFYDIVGRYISGSDAYNSEIAVPANAYYFAFSVCNMDVSQAYVFSDIDFNSVLNSINQVSVTKSYLDNITKVPFTLTGNKYVVPSTGEIANFRNANYYASDKTYIRGASKLKLISSFATATGFAFYDIDKVYISGSTTHPTDLIDVPSNAYYFAFSACNIDTSKVELNAFNSLVNPLNQTSTTVATPKFNYSIAMGNVLMIGDSLTSGAYYDGGAFKGASINQNVPFYLGKLANTDVKNGGFSGSQSEHWYKTEMPKYNLSDYDTFFIWLGTNDGLTDTLATDVNPYTDPAQFATTRTGYYCKIIEAIKAANPDAQIHLSTIFVTNGNLAETNLTINHIAQKYGLMVMDMSDLSSSKKPVLHLNNGNIHFGKAGNVYIANRIFNLINDYYDANQIKLEFGLTHRTN